MSRVLNVPKLCPFLGCKRRSRVSTCGHFYLLSSLDAPHFPWRKAAHRLEVILCFSKKSISYVDRGFKNLFPQYIFSSAVLHECALVIYVFCNLVEFLDSIIKSPLLHLLFFLLFSAALFHVNEKILKIFNFWGRETIFPERVRGVVEFQCCANCIFRSTFIRMELNS